MCPGLRDLAPVENHDLLGIPHRREAVCDRDRRTPLGKTLERLLDEPFGLRVERRGGLVEHEDRRVPQDRPRNRHALPLAAREPVSALADDGVVPVRERCNELVDLCCPRRLLDLLVTRLRLRKAKVLAHRRMEEVGLLRDDTDGRGERLERQLADVDAVDRDGALGRVVKSRHEIAARRLARAGLTDERRLRARRNRERDVLQRQGVSVVAEADPVEGHVAAGPLEHACPLDDVDGLVEVVEDAVEQRQRALHLELDAQQSPDRKEQPRLQRGERDQCPDRDDGCPARLRPAGEPVDEGGHHRERHLDRCHHPAAGHPASHLEIGKAPRLVGEPLREVAGAPHRLAEQNARDRQ